MQTSNFTKGNSDNLTVAVMGLDIFTKSFCMNCEETEKQNDLVFRCDECEFKDENENCMMKRFVLNHAPEYKGDFGSMGKL